MQRRLWLLATAVMCLLWATAAPAKEATVTLEVTGMH